MESRTCPEQLTIFFCRISIPLTTWRAGWCATAKTLSALPVRFREILVLRELEGLSYKEIAEVMGMPIGTVMSTLSRARLRFRDAAGDLLTTHRSSESDSPAVNERECVGAGARE